MTKLCNCIAGALVLALLVAAAARPAAAQPARKGAKAARNSAAVGKLPALATWELENGLRVAYMPERRA